MEIVAIVDSREALSAESQKQTVSGEKLPGHSVVGIEGSHGLTGAYVEPIGGGKRRNLGCDIVLMSGGWDPRVHLSSQTGARPQYDEGIASFVPGSAVQNERSVGAAAGNFGTAQCLEHGQVQSNSALRELGMSDEQPLEVLATEPESPITSNRPGVYLRLTSVVPL